MDELQAETHLENSAVYYSRAYWRVLIMYTNQLVRKAGYDREKKIRLWANAIKLIGSSNFDENVDIELSLSVIQDNADLFHNPYRRKLRILYHQ